MLQIDWESLAYVFPIDTLSLSIGQHHSEYQTARVPDRHFFFCATVDMDLFNAMSKVLRPNIEVAVKAKIPRGPRITWLNRAISLYLHFIGVEILKLEPKSRLLQVSNLCEQRSAHPLEHYRSCNTGNSLIVSIEGI
jgi:hypothetical protein